MSDLLGVKSYPDALPAQSWQAVCRDWYRLARRSDFVRKVLGTYATQIVMLVLAVFTNAVVARILGPEGRGRYAVAAAIGALGMQFGNFGLHASNTYFVAKNRDLLSRLLGNSLIVSFGAGGAGAMLLGVVFLIWPRLAPVTGGLLVIGLLWIPFGLAYMLGQNLLMGIQEVRTYNHIELGNKVFGFVLIVLLIRSKAITPESVLAVVLLALVSSAGISLWRLRRLAGRGPNRSLCLFKDCLSVGVKAYLAAFFAFLVLRADLLMVKYILGAEQAGYYSVAAMMADCILLLPAAIGMVLFPKLSAMPAVKEARHWARKVVLATAVILFPVMLISGFSARIVIHLAFGAAFLPAASALVWLTPGIFFLGIEIVLVQFLNSLGFPWAVVLAWFLSSLLNIALNLWAIPNYGIVGASVVSSLSYFLMFISVLWIIRSGKLSEPMPTEMPVSYVP